MEKLHTVQEIYRDPESFLNRNIQIGGWVRSNRSSRNFGFLTVQDGSCFQTLQAVYGNHMENFQEISRLNVGSAVIVRGRLVPTPEARQPFELQAEAVEVEGASTPDYPLQKKRHSLEYLRTISHLRPRTNTFQAVFRVRSLAAHAIHCFFQDQGFVYVHTPLITGSDCEGGKGRCFRSLPWTRKILPEIKKAGWTTAKIFFGKKTSLTVSGQLSGETFAQAFRKIYTFGPTFRAENSNTPRHAAEFWMIEPEMAFADLEDEMELAEAMLKYVIRFVMERAPGGN